MQGAEAAAEVAMLDAHQQQPTRSKRQIKRPSRFEDEDVYWDLPLPSMREAPPRYVYRMLKRKDVRADLLNKQVYVFWPDTQQWYKGLVRKVRPKTLEITVYYPEDDQCEFVGVAALIQEGHIAIVEERPAGAPLKHGEVPVDEADRATAVYLEDYVDSGDEEPVAGDDDVYRVSDEEEAAGHDSADDDFEATDSDEERQLRAERLKGAALRAVSRNKQGMQINRASKRFKESEPEAAAGGSVKRSKTGSTAGGANRAAPAGEGGGNTVEEAARFKNALLGMLINKFSAAEEAPGAGGAAGMKPKSKAAQAAATAAQEEDIRRRAREQLVAALRVAAEELRGEQLVDEATMAEPGDVGVAVELALYKANGGLTKEYKAKFRSLVFNLKDPANPDLRARVLLGELSPDALVGLGPTELASRQLSAFRQKKAEEMAKAKFLDGETAAKFSTAAAAALKEQHQAQLSQVSNKLLTVQDLPGPAPRADEAEEDEEARALQQAQAAAEAAQQQAGEAGADGQPRPPMLETAGSSFLHTSMSIDKAASGSLLSPSEQALGLARAGSKGLGSGDINALLGRLSGDGGAGGATGAAAASTPAAATDLTGSAAKVISLKPALPAPQPEVANDDDDEYNPDDFIVGEEGAEPHKASSSAGTPKPSATSLSSPSRNGNHGSGGGSAGNHHHSKHHHHHAVLPPQQAPARAHAGPDAKQGSSRGVGLEPDLDHMLPMVVSPDAGSPAAAIMPGTIVWQGRLSAPECGVVHVEASTLGGMAELALLLGPPQPLLMQELEVKGVVRLDKAQDFMEELRTRSRSRTATLGLLRAAGAGGTADSSTNPLHRLVSFYANRQRSGVFHPMAGLEAYLLPPSKLARRLLLSARLIAPKTVAGSFPLDLPEDSLLVAIIHRKDWAPPPTARPPTYPPAPVPQQQSLSLPGQSSLGGSKPLQPPNVRSSIDPRQSLTNSTAPAPRAADRSSPQHSQPTDASTGGGAYDPREPPAQEPQQPPQQLPTEYHVSPRPHAEQPDGGQQQQQQPTEQQQQQQGAPQEAAPAPAPMVPDLTHLLAQLAPALQQAPTHSPAHAQQQPQQPPALPEQYMQEQQPPPQPQAQQQQLPASYHMSPGSTDGQPPPPYNQQQLEQQQQQALQQSQPGLPGMPPPGAGPPDLSALSSLVSALQGQLQHNQPQQQEAQQQQPGFPFPAAALPQLLPQLFAANPALAAAAAAGPAAAAVPPAPGAAGGPPMLVMQPDGTYAVLGGLEGAGSGLPGMLMMPPGGAAQPPSQPGGGLPPPPAHHHGLPGPPAGPSPWQQQQQGRPHWEQQQQQPAAYWGQQQQQQQQQGMWQHGPGQGRDGPQHPHSRGSGFPPHQQHHDGGGRYPRHPGDGGGRGRGGGRGWR